MASPTGREVLLAGQGVGLEAVISRGPLVDGTPPSRELLGPHLRADPTMSHALSDSKNPMPMTVWLPWPSCLICVNGKSEQLCAPRRRSPVSSCLGSVRVGTGSRARLGAQQRVSVLADPAFRDIYTFPGPTGFTPR